MLDPTLITRTMSPADVLAAIVLTFLPRNPHAREPVMPNEPAVITPAAPKPTVVFQPAGENLWVLDADPHTTIVLSCRYGCWELSYVTPVGTETTAVLTMAGLVDQLRQWGVLPREEAGGTAVGFGGATGEPPVVRRWNEPEWMREHAAKEGWTEPKEEPTT